MAVRFLLNGAPRAEEAASPTMTVLDWLRTVARLTGTKEGCAEGDCGACTIAIGRMRDGAVRYEAVNSCLMLLPQLDGAAVLTVEGVADGPRLHPVQKAMLEADATQCGFCTPGFVMSMVALQQEGGAQSDDAIHEALAGNLCRCTGYRAIVDACRRLPSAPLMPSENGAAMPARVGAYRVQDQTFLAPSTLEELLALRARHPEAVLLGGGTDLGLRVSKDRERWPLVISTGAVEELRRIEVTSDAIEIGGAVTYSDLLPQLDRHFPAFAALARRLGSRQIRNLGTLAGNLATASPIGDTLPCLIALGATVRLRSEAGGRTLRVEDFITGYRTTALAADEVIESISIPLLAPDVLFAAYKTSKRFDQDISTVVAAFRMKMDGGHVRDLAAVFGGMATRVQRATSLEGVAVGRPWRADALAGLETLLAQDFSPLSDHRGSAAYRLRAAAGLVRRFHLETSTQTILVRLEAL
jgi:xanthine dehydrogenase small subunit